MRHLQSSAYTRPVTGCNPARENAGASIARDLALNVIPPLNASSGVGRLGMPTLPAIQRRTKRIPQQPLQKCLDVRFSKRHIQSPGKRCKGARHPRWRDGCSVLELSNNLGIGMRSCLRLLILDILFSSQCFNAEEAVASEVAYLLCYSKILL
jgi:hypothetical protein